jgi:hypothetical protein
LLAEVPPSCKLAQTLFGKSNHSAKRAYGTSTLIDKIWDQHVIRELSDGRTPCASTAT